jgi:hypothetical protein
VVLARHDDHDRQLVPYVAQAPDRAAGLGRAITSGFLEQHQHRLFSLCERRRVFNGAYMSMHLVIAQEIGKLGDS